MANSSAPGPLAGYLWQLRKTLVGLLSLDFGEAVTIEREDDICTVRLPGPVLLCAEQAKHSFEPGTLTVRSPSLWKTVRIWAGLEAANKCPPRVVLAITDTADAVLAALCKGGTRTPENLEALAQDLDCVASAGGNGALLACYQAWLALSPPEKSNILRRAEIDAESPRLSDVGEQLGRAVRRHHIPQHDVADVSRSVEGWFVETVSNRLDAGGCIVTFDEVFNLLQSQHAKYRPAPAPEEPSGRGAEVDALTSGLVGTGATFLQQLQTLDASGKNLERATSLYARARVARSCWLEEAAVAVPQLSRFDSELRERWQTEFEKAERDTKAGSLSDEQLRNAGWRVFDACMTHLPFFGERPSETYLANGSYHILADVPEVGWHPRFATLLAGKSSND